jgi:hypothetical protein
MHIYMHICMSSYTYILCCLAGDYASGRDTCSYIRIHRVIATGAVMWPCEWERYMFLYTYIQGDRDGSGDVAMRVGEIHVLIYVYAG